LTKVGKRYIEGSDYPTIGKVYTIGRNSGQGFEDSVKNGGV